MPSKGKFPSCGAGFGVICQVNHDIFSCLEQRQLEYVTFHPRKGIQVNNSQQTIVPSTESESLKVLSFMFTTFFHDLPVRETQSTGKMKIGTLYGALEPSQCGRQGRPRFQSEGNAGIRIRPSLRENGKNNKSDLINI